MPLFVMSCLDKPGSAALRAATRPAHLAYLEANPGVVRLAGPYMNDAGDSVGSMFVMQGEDRAAIEAYAADDPYFRAGLFGSVDIRPWRVVIGELA
ncbi:MAG TPA: YciI family protein [Caulobacteraceae bacterium]|nr:YciI family protein [Caulobacteraceae bacterium]